MSNGLITALLVAGVMLIAQPCHADDFCDALRDVIAAAPTGFQSIKGKAEWDDQRSFRHVFSIPEANPARGGETPCWVFGPAGAASTFKYSCTFGKPANWPNANEIKDAFAARVYSCLKPVAPNIEASTHSQAGANLPHRFVVGHADIEVLMSFPPDGGLGTLYLTVSQPETN